MLIMKNSIKICKIFDVSFVVFNYFWLVLYNRFYCLSYGYS